MQEEGLRMDCERLCVSWFQLRLTQEKGDLLGDDGLPPGVGEKLKGRAWEMGRAAGNPRPRGPISIMAQDGTLGTCWGIHAAAHAP